MSENSYEIDKAMNLIKEEIIKDLSDSVSRQNNKSFISDFTPNSIFCENYKD